MNTEIQHYNGIPLRLILRNDYPRKKAKRYVINGTNQNVWIPNKHLLKDGTIKEDANIDYIIAKARIQHKLKYAGLEG